MNSLVDHITIARDYHLARVRRWLEMNGAPNPSNFTTWLERTGGPAIDARLAELAAALAAKAERAETLLQLTEDLESEAAGLSRDLALDDPAPTGHWLLAEALAKLERRAQQEHLKFVRSLAEHGRLLLKRMAEKR